MTSPKLTRFERLDDEAVGPNGPCPGFLGARRASGHRDNQDVLGSRVILQDLCRFQAVHARHRQVHENQRRRIGKRQIESFLAITRHRHGEAAKLQVGREHLSAVWKIINDENLWWRHATLRDLGKTTGYHARCPLADHHRHSRLDGLCASAIRAIHVARWEASTRARATVSPQETVMHQCGCPGAEEGRNASVTVSRLASMARL